jgi:hypothetical protein
MIEELARLKEISAVGLQGIKSTAAAAKSLQTVALSSAKGDLPSREVPVKAKESMAAITAELDAQKKLLAEVKALVDRIEQAQIDDTKGVLPLDIARQFKTVVDTVQSDLAAQTGAVGTALRGFDVELKGIVVVDNSQTRVMLPPPTEKLEAHQVSTFRMSFGAVPLVRSDAAATDSQK